MNDVNKIMLQAVDENKIHDLNRIIIIIIGRNVEAGNNYIIVIWNAHILW